jgi:hypothetical protein
MVGKFGPSEVFIVVEKEGAINAYQLDATDSNNNRDEIEATINLLNIASIFQAILNLVPTTSTNAFEPIVCFYVEMPQNPTTPTNNQQDELVVNLDDCSLELNVLIIPS